MTTVAQQLGARLAAWGVTRAFGVVGSGNFELTNALRAAGVPFTAARHEGGAATMADAYARMSGELAAVSVHQGCGLTNAATGISEAAKSRTPLLVLAPQAPAAQLHSNFAIDQDAFARSLQAVPERVHSPATALAAAARAVRTAVRDRRTVVLNLPIDILAAPAAEPPAGRGADRTDGADVLAGASAQRILPRPPLQPAPDEIRATVAALGTAQRPVIIAGRGARHAREELTALADRAGALLATSAVAKGLFRGHPADLGISGGFSSPAVAELISRADLVIAFGCALNMWTTRHGSLIGPDTVLVQVDDQDEALGAHRPIDHGVLGDSAVAASAMLEEIVTAAAPPRTGYRTPEVMRRLREQGRWEQTPTPDLSVPGRRIDPRELTRRLNDLLPAQRVVSIDSGNFMGYPSQYLDVPDQFGFCFTQAFQSIGLGLSTAIGTALAQPQRLPVLGTGDGGFLMMAQELETAVRLGLPLVVIVYDDAAYSAEVHHFGDADMTAVTFPDTDIAAIARGFGADGLTVRDVADLDAVAEWLAADPRRPLVIDAKIADDGGSWWLAEAFRGH